MGTNLNLPDRYEYTKPLEPKEDSPALRTLAYTLLLVICCLLWFHLSNTRRKPRAELSQNATTGGTATWDEARTRRAERSNAGVFCHIDNCGAKISLLIFLGDGKHLVCACNVEKVIQMWNIEDDKEKEPLKSNLGVAVNAVAASKVENLFVTGGVDGKVAIWDTSLQKRSEGTQRHDGMITTLDVSSDASVVASGSSNGTVMVWKMEGLGFPLIPGRLVRHGSISVSSVKISPAGSRIASGCGERAYSVKIWHSRTGDQLESIRFDGSPTYALAWSSDGRRLFSAGDNGTIGCFDTVTRRSSSQVVKPCDGDDYISSLWVSNSDQFLVSFSAPGGTVYVWDIRHTPSTKLLCSYRGCVAATLSPDDLYLANSGDHKRICIRDLFEVIEASYFFLRIAPFVNHSEPVCMSNPLTQLYDTYRIQFTYLTPAAHQAWKAGELAQAEDILSREIGDKRYKSFEFYARANRALVRIRRGNFREALDDDVGIPVGDTQAPLVTHIAKIMALIEQGRRQEAIERFESLQYGDAMSFAECVKSVLLFQVEVHVNPDHGTGFAEPFTLGGPLSCPWVEKRELLVLAEYYIRGREYNKGLRLLTTSPDLRPPYYVPEEGLILLLFGWGVYDLQYMVQQLICRTLFASKRTREVDLNFLQISDNTLDEENEARKTDLGWLSEGLGDEAMRRMRFDDATAWYSVSFGLCPESRVIHRESEFAKECLSAIEMACDASNGALAEELELIALYPPGSARLLAKRSRANAYTERWCDSLEDADQAIETDRWCPWGYERRYVALHTLHRHEEATKTLCTLFTKFEQSADTSICWLRAKYVAPTAAIEMIDGIIKAIHGISPFVLIDIRTGKLCNAAERVRLFKADYIFHELVSSMCMELDTNHIKKVVAGYFRYVMFSHTWEGEEPTFEDISKNSVYKDDPHPLKHKLRHFCETVQADPKGYLWAWSDTCCIDKTIETVYRESIRSMYSWYKESTLTIVLLAHGSSTLKNNRWMTRAWTLQELLSPKTIQFYDRDWKLYQGDSLPNHKQSPSIIQELAEATDILQGTLVDFSPKSLSIRAKLRLASTREATKKVDIAYALIGIFESDLIPEYREPEVALGLLLEEILHREGDAKAVLDWVGKASQFNSCLPAQISAYKYPPHTHTPIPENVMEARAAELRAMLPPQDVATFFETLSTLGSTVAFVHRRLSLPCIIFSVSVNPTRYDQVSATRVYQAQAEALGRFEFKTSCTAITEQDEVVLVHPWIRDLLAQTDGREWDHYTRALRVVAHLEQPFRALLLAKQTVANTYKRVAADSEILIPRRSVMSLENISIKVLEIR